MKAVPSGETLMTKSSEPSSPTSARLLQPSWKTKPASRLAADLLRVRWRWPEPGVTSSCDISTASALTARRLLASAVVLMPSLARLPANRAPAKSVQPPVSST